jgi:hypothetical protein
MCFSPDGRRLAVSVIYDRRVKVFDWEGEDLAACDSYKPEA